MANPAESEVQNLLPVQAYFNVDGSFNTFIGQNKPFYATPDPQQSGLQITNSTINSSVIGGITPAAGNFTTATVLSQPVGATDVVNLLALQSYAAGISWKQPCVAATLTNITLSGLQTIDGKAVVAGDRVLVKDQSTAANNGIYIASASTWTRSTDADTWDELICAISFIEYGTQAGGAWFCTAQDGGTLGVTAVNWAQFTTSATYSAGTGLTLTGTVFSITPVGTASTYGSASTVPVFTTNASGQVSSVTNTNIAIGATQITSGTIDSARISGSYTGITGVGTLTDLTVTNNIVGSITGNAATATTATNITGGAAGSVPYQTGSGATGFLAAGTNGQVLTLASGVPSWATPTTGTVTSVSGAGTVNGLTLTGTVTSSGSLTLGGTLDLSSPPTIGNTAPNTGRFTSLTVDDNTTLGSSNTDTVTFTARVNSDFDPATDNAYDLGRTGHEWRNLFITGTANIDSLVADTADINAGTIDNTVIGATTPLAGTFTDLRFNGTLSLAGSTGTSGYVLTSNGASAPTWQANANGLDIVDDTTTNATRYITFTSATSGNITTENVSSTQLTFNPSSGSLGIGTSSPAGVLDVKGATPQIIARGSTGVEPRVRWFSDATARGGIASSATYGLDINSETSMRFFTNGGAGSTTPVVIDTSGNVGIGTSSPTTKLSITDSGGPIVRLVRTSNRFEVSADNDFMQLNARDASTYMRFLTADTERMRITSTGNVGIGTSSPSYALDVRAATGIISTTSTTGTNVSYVAANNTGGFFAIGRDSSGGGLTGTAYSSFVYSDGSYPIIFSTNATERMRITSAGNVGIGTASPSATLDVGSSISRSGAAQNNIYADYRITAATTGIAGSLASRIVGIGGSTYTIPDVAVYKADPTVAQTGVTITNAYGLYIGNMADPTSGGTVTNSWGVYQTSSSNNNYFNGSVLVGATSFSVGTNCIQLGNASNSRININNNADYGIEMYGSTTSRVSFYSSNGSTTRVGAVTVNTSNTTYATSSDYRLKEGIAPMTGALATVAQLKPVTYKWKIDGSDGQGFIAHELAEVVPDAVIGEKDAVNADGSINPQSIDTSFLVATLTAAIQELKAELDSVKAELQTLKGN